MADLEKVKSEAQEVITKAQTGASLEEVRLQLFGKKGTITSLMKNLGSMPAQERKAYGAAVNSMKTALQALFDQKKEDITAQELQARLVNEKLDVTLPVGAPALGCVHPLSQVTEELISLFASMGFKQAKGPDIETDWYNFTALNLPPDHPARQMQDTFYLPPQGEEPMVLRTQTSPVQIRAMQAQQPPLRIISLGRTFRSDHDMTHSPMFHQMEGLVIDETTNMAHLKGCLMDFLRQFFGVPDLPVRFRPSYFPFTEPSAEVDIGCSRKGGELKFGAYGDWMEILGCGMVNPRVLENAGYDPERYQGFAFGMGIERLAMLKYGIPDIRSFFDADMQWLRHYGFLAAWRPNPAFGI